MKKRKLNILDIKQALYDERFQLLFPELKTEIQQYLKKPTCPCNAPLYTKLWTNRKALETYFPDREIEENKEMTDNWTVINCHVNDLERKIRQLPKGNKQIAIARYQDQVTVVVNETGWML